MIRKPILHLLAGGTNVDSVTYSYNDVTHSFSSRPINPIAALAGADGIIFDANGNLLIGGQGAHQVYQITTGGALVNPAPSNRSSFHEAGTTSAADGSSLTVSAGQYTRDFDQGAVDGHGHALVAGCVFLFSGTALSASPFEGARLDRVFERPAFGAGATIFSL